MQRNTSREWCRAWTFSYHRYHRAGNPRPLGALPQRLSEVPSLTVQLARLNQALRSLDLDREATVSTQELAPAVDRLLDAFVPGEAGFAADASPEELLIRSAWLIRIMFDGVLGGSRQELNQLIAGLVEARQRPAETFLASYQPFAASPGGDGADVGDPHGVGPLEPAGVFTLEPWHTLGNVHRHDPGSIVPHLQDLAAELRPHMA